MINAPRKPPSPSGKLFICLLGFLLIAPGRLPLAEAAEIIIGTGPPGTFANHTARLLCRIIERNQDKFTCSLQESSDSVDMLTNVQGGSLDLALVDSYLLHESLSRTGPFAYLGISYERVRVVTPLYQNPMSLVVRTDAGVNSIDEITGKRINSGAPGSYQQRLFRAILKTYGWSEQDFSLLSALSATLAQDKLAFKQGGIQALFHHGVHPDPALQPLLADSPARLIGLEAPEGKSLAERNPAFSTATINSRYYDEIEADIRTLATTMVLVCSSDMDAHTVRTIVMALRDNRQLLHSSHPALSEFELGKDSLWFGGIKQHSAVPPMVTNEE